MTQAQSTAVADAAMAAPGVSVVIPCFRDEQGLPQLFGRLRPVLGTLPGGAELVLVDDGSPDRTGQVAMELAQSYEYPVTVVRLLRNFGQHAAVFAGFEVSRGNVVVTLDSDLQYPPEQIALLLSNLSDDFPVVSGYRKDRRDPLVRRLITATLSWWLRKRTGTTLRDFGSMFRAYDRAIVTQLMQFEERRRFLTALVAWLGVPVKEIPVQHEPRGELGTRYRAKALIDMLLDLLTGFSTFPLRVISACAFLGAIAGFLAFFSFAVYRIFEGSGDAGTVTAFAFVFLLLAVQLLLLALLGEYLGRVYIEVKERPYYLIRDIRRNR
jgi:undecaprenyl-phosphate 4-deoxy-4-formamido-L-arabinose transferase